MGKPGRPASGNNSNNSNRDLAHGFMDFLGQCAKLLMWAGGLVSVAVLGILIYYVFAFATGASKAAEAQAISNLALFQSTLSLSLVAFAVGASFLWWGEPKLPITLFVVAALVAGGPFYLPLLGPVKSAVPARAVQSMQDAGTIFFVIAAGVIVAEIAIRIKERISVGMKADQLKFGKGIKEEVGQKNVFLGKCWQLPYCRKFIRERCPIYHSGRTCWRERTGCMCEEEVIRGAMENKVIPKDALKAAAMIPRNTRLTAIQKIARCRQCVIYNEHQKQKYKLWLNVTIVACLGVGYMMWTPLVTLLQNSMAGIDSLASSALAGTVHTGLHEFATTTTVPIMQILAGALMLILFAYVLKTLEYLIFTLKI